MPGLNSATLASQPIQIPSDFPGILKQYTKAAIRTQPRDLLLWSASYFRCLARGEVPPAKDRLEYPVPDSSTGLSTGLLRVLHRQLGDHIKVKESLLSEKWRGVCLSLSFLDELLMDGGWKNKDIDWVKFVGIAAESMSKSGMEGTLKIVCEVFSTHQDGISASIPIRQFLEIYNFLADRKQIPSSQMDEVTSYMRKAASLQDGTINPHNLRAPDCPPLQ